jgi:hypothetical protein
MNMSDTPEEKEHVKKMAKLRANLEQKIESLEEELEAQRTLLALIDSALVQQSFKRAEIQKPSQASTLQYVSPKPVTKQSEVPISVEVKPQRKGIILKTITGDVLAELLLEQDVLRILFPVDKDFDINIPPFTSFFVERVLAKMLEKDKEDVNAGKLDPDTIISFDIIQDGNTLKEIIIKNLRPERLRELKSSLRWTLEKMFERMQQNS